MARRFNDISRVIALKDLYNSKEKSTLYEMTVNVISEAMRDPLNALYSETNNIPNTLVGLNEKGQVIGGLIGNRTKEGRFVVNFLGVSPKYQSVGEKLLYKAEEVAKRDGLKGVILEAYKNSDKKDLNEWYAKRGYQLVKYADRDFLSKNL